MTPSKGSTVDPAKVEELSKKIAEIDKGQAVAEESRRNLTTQIEESRREAREANLRLEISIKTFVEDIKKSVNGLAAEINMVAKIDSSRELRYSWSLVSLLVALVGSLLVIAGSLVWNIFHH